MQIEYYTLVAPYPPTLENLRYAVCHQLALKGRFDKLAEGASTVADVDGGVNSPDKHLTRPDEVIREYLDAFGLKEQLGSGIFICAGMGKKKDPYTDEVKDELQSPDHWWIRAGHYLYDTGPDQPIRRVNANSEHWPPHYFLLNKDDPVIAGLTYTKWGHIHDEKAYFIGEVEVAPNQLGDWKPFGSDDVRQIIMTGQGIWESKNVPPAPVIIWESDTTWAFD